MVTLLPMDEGRPLSNNGSLALPPTPDVNAKTSGHNGQGLRQARMVQWPQGVAPFVILDADIIRELMRAQYYYDHPNEQTPEIIKLCNSLQGPPQNLFDYLSRPHHKNKSGLPRPLASQ